MQGLQDVVLTVPPYVLTVHLRYPSRAGILQHLRIAGSGPAWFWTYGQVGCSEVL
jgi:hypothetical protein